MNREIIKRLKFVMQEHGATSEDIVNSFRNYRITEKAEVAYRYFGEIMSLKRDIRAIEVIAFAKACNCTTDYLLGLSDRMN